MSRRMTEYYDPATTWSTWLSGRIGFVWSSKVKAQRLCQVHRPGSTI